MKKEFSHTEGQANTERQILVNCKVPGYHSHIHQHFKYTLDLNKIWFKEIPLGFSTFAKWAALFGE